MTLVLAISGVIAWLLILGVLLKVNSTQRKALRVSGEFVRKVHRLALDNAETDPFARIYLDEHRTYVDRLYDLTEPKKQAKR
jgi:hypothetical protein